MPAAEPDKGSWPGKRMTTLSPTLLGPAALDPASHANQAVAQVGALGNTLTTHAVHSSTGLHPRHPPHKPHTGSANVPLTAPSPAETLTPKP